MRELLSKLRRNNILLKLKDGALSVKYPKGKADQELLDEINLNKAALINYLTALSLKGYADIPKVNEQADYPLSSSQRRLWVLSQFPESNMAYNMPGTCLFEGDLNIAALSYAFTILIARHESLRTIFKQNENGEPRQVILSPDIAEAFEITIRDIRQETELTEQLIRQDLSRPFNLKHDALLRASLYQVADNRWVFTYVMHHIISDGWSMNILISELLMLYNARVKGQPLQLSPLSIQYKDYASWQQQLLNTESLLSDKNYWLKQLSGELPVIELPLDRTRPALKTYNGGNITRKLDRRASDALIKLCRQQEATLFMGLLAAVTTLLYRYSGQEDIIIGSPIAGREHADLEHQIGFYLNTLALRMQFNGQQHFTELLRQTKLVNTGAYEHQLYPFDQLTDELQLQRDISRSPLFDVLIDYHDNKGKVLTGEQILEGLKISTFETGTSAISKFDLTFMFIESQGDLSLLLEYNSDLFERDTIERMFSHLEGVLSAVTVAPAQAIAELDYIGAQEKGMLLNEFNDIPLLYDGYRSIVELFREKVLLHPDAAALRFEGATLSYQQLDDLSERLAAHLSSKYALHADSLVGVMMERSEKLIIAILAILKAGAAYVPIDPAYPGPRKQFIVEDAAIELLITQSDFIFDLDYYDGSVFAIDVELDGLAATSANFTAIKAESLAYVIYTSGSTGQPKGCAITNANLSHYISWANHYYFDSSAQGNFGLFTSISFDLSVTSIFCPLTQGGTLSIYGQEQDIPSILQHSFSLQSGINAIKLTPSHVNLLQQLDISETGIRKVILGGEAVTEEHVRILKEIKPSIQVYNEYGPTEATVGCIVKELEPGTPVLIGKPISATEIFILNDHQLAPVGVSGEICISGAGLAKQYLNNPALTAQKFIANPFRAGERMYRTGDLGRWLPNGEIQYFGRKDEQVKIRGYRIEPGEIEIILLAYNDITAAAVIVRENELVAYLVSNQSIEVADVKAYLSQHLPAYMLPAYYVQLESLPLTTNGKIDKKQLPDPEGLALTVNEYVAPQTATERQLAAIWQDILGKEKVGIKDNFFDIGGDSIKILRMLAAVRKELSIDIPIADVYKHSTIEGLILHIAAHKDTLDEQQQHEAEKEAALLKEFEILKATILESALPSGQHKSEKDNSDKYSSDRKDNDRNIIDWNNIEDVYPMSDIEKGMAFESLINQASGMYHDQMVHQRFFPRFDNRRFSQALQLLTNKHSILRTSFNLNDFDREVQLVHKNIQIPFLYKELSNLNRSSQEEIIRTFLADEMKKPFDIQQAPLWRMAAFNLGNDEIIFVFQCHHAIIDGWSDALLMTALNNLYLQLGENPDYIPAALKTTYKDFIIRHELDKKDERIRSFWKQELADADRLDLFKPEADLQLQRYHLDKQLLNRLEQTAAMLNSSVKAISLSAYLYMLKVLNYESDILTGLVSNMRPNLEDSDQLLGCFLNTIPFRMDIPDTISGNSLVKLVQEKLITLKANERLSMHEIAQLHNKKAKAGNPFFDVLFDYVDFHAFNDIEEVTNNDLPALDVEGGVDLTNTFLDFMVNRTRGNYVLTIRLTRTLKAGFNTDRLASLFFNILEFIVSTPSQGLNKAAYIGTEERSMLLETFNDIPLLYTAEESVIDLFRKQAQQQPDATALLFEGTTLSYQQLDEISDRLAGYLSAKHQLRADSLVGIMMERSEKLIISILAILKAGAAYVPVDPAYPAARKQFITADAAIELLITQSDFIFDLDYYKGPVFAVDLEMEGLATASANIADIKPASLAYVIYTSGSTGQPKGCAITNANLAHYIRWANQYYFEQSAPGNFGLFTSISFDLSVTSIFCPLTQGGTLTIYKQQLDIAAILQHSFSVESGINAIKLTPSHVNLLQQLELNDTGINKAILGGEAVNEEHVRILKSINPAMQVYNEYGPTEATVGCIVKELEADTAVLIGKPISATEIFILGAADQLLPMGVSGEICISGAGLARHYLNNPTLTAQKFVPNPFRPGQRMYKTGDLGRWLADGEIQYLGRKDEQLKIRGYRIEPAEIENTLLSYPDITATAVVVRDNELTAYLVSNQSIEVADVKAYLSQHLPTYMTPAYYVQLDELPLTTNGKIDKKQLPDHAGLALNGNEYVAPQTATEQQLADIWQEILGKEPVGIKDNFFDLGGHSLSAIKLAGQLQRKFNVKIDLKDIFNRPVLEDQALLLTHASAGAFISIPKAAIQHDYPLSSAQRRLWVLSQFPESNVAYNMPGVYVFEGALDTAALSAAFDSLIARHESLRTIFIQNELGEPRQVILPVEEAGFSIVSHDLRREKEQEILVDALISQDLSSAFNLTNDSLLRVTLYQVADDRWIFVYIMHHIISDGWSMEILIDELLQFYNGEAARLAPLAIQYKDYASWQQQQLSGETLVDHKSYWLEQLSGELPILELPLDKSRPALKTFNGSSVNRRLNVDLSEEFKMRCRQQDVTLYMGLLAAVTTLLYRYSGQQDIIIGSPIAGREHADLAQQIGFYLNTLALRMQFNGQDNFNDLLKQAKEVTTAAYEHQVYPFDQLIDELQIHRDISRSPLFDVLIDFHDNKTHASNQVMNDLRVESYYAAAPAISKFDLTFMFSESAAGLNLQLEYNTDLFERDTIERMFSHLEGILKAVSTTPQNAIATINYISQEERTTLLEEFNNIPVFNDVSSSIIDMFREQVQLHPDAAALLFEGTTLSYRQLDEISDRLAGHLSANYALTDDSLVGIMMDRSEKLIIAILAILKSGAAYVPVDPAYPVARKQFIIADAAIELLITQTDYIFDLDYYQGAVFAADAQLEFTTNPYPVPARPVYNPQALAYVIYTSGSTGQPKGCAITNANLSHYISWANRYYFDSSAPGNFGLFTSISFDLSVTSIFCPLTQGGTLSIYEQQQDIPSILQHSFSPQSGINAVKLTPSHVNLLQQLDISETGISKVILGGEAVSEEHVRILKEINPAIQVYNEYGPTEATVGCIVKEMEPGTPVLIGRPISATEIFILNDYQLAPVGVSGEICISGAGLAKQYLNNPALTSQKFVANPFRAGERMYRTGDLGRWLPNGEIQYFGRKDEQVKIRGYRIEPGEIENILLAYADITAAAVIVREKELVAYLVSNQSIEVADVKAYLSQHLPAYMLPAYYVQLESLPLTTNGKIDKKQLPDPEGLALTASEYVAPQTATEQQLAAIWQDILGKEQVGIKDNFFDIGGDSIKILRMLAAVRKELGIDIPIADVYKHSTIEGLVLHITAHKDTLDQQQQNEAEKEAALLKEFEVLKATILESALLNTTDEPIIDWNNIEDVYPMSDIEKGMAFESLVNQASGMYHDQMVHQRFFPQFDSKRFSQALQLLSNKHSILRTSFNLNDFDREVQLVHKNIQIPFVYKELNNITRSSQEEIIKTFLADEMKKPFDIQQAPLWRMAAFNLGNDEIIFVFQCHHAIIDGWSDALLMTALNNLYLQLAEDPDYIPAALKTTYKDFIIRHELDKKDESIRSFWKQELADADRLDLFTTNAELQLQHYSLNQSLLKQLEQTAIMLNSSVKAISLSAYLYMLKVLNYESDIITGLVSNMRPNLEDSDQLLGCFLNTIPFRMDIADTISGNSLVKQVQEKLVMLKANERLSMLEIARLHDKQSKAGNPFFDVLFDYVDFHAFNAVQQVAANDLPKLDVKGGVDLTNTFLDFMINRTGGNYVLTIRLTRRLKAGFDTNKIANLFFSILEHIVATPALALNKAAYVSTEERRMLLSEFNSIPLLYNGYRSIADLFGAQVRQHPHATAVLFENTALSYLQLDDLSNRLAAHLMASHGLTADSLVGIMMDRSEKLIIAILAILKAGAAYVPVDPAYPLARKQFIIEDAAIQLLITQSDFILDLDYYKGPLFAIDVELEALAAANITAVKDNPEALAYVIYTSGSTGQPKGCAITNANLSHYIRWANQYYFEQAAPGNFGLFSSISFDLSVTSILCPLTQGGILTIYNQQQDIAAVLEHSFSKTSGINSIKLTPSHVNLLQQLEISGTGINKAILGGEAVNEEHIRILKSINPAMQVYNEYGPTEATVGCIVKELEPETPVLIGKPISATEIFILGTADQLLPIGVSGEICISGAGLAKQYLNNFTLTAQKFVPNPYRPDQRMYKTGDLGRWLANGEIQYLGRKDEQVKIRGYRIEPGEIENLLLLYPDVTAATVLARNDELLAYLVSNQAVEAMELKAYLSAHLPAYMLPAYYIQLDELPLTSNGKTDKKQLPDPGGLALDNGVEYVAPQNETEHRLVAIWQEVLGRENIGIKHNFFELGGHSLTAIRILSKIRNEFKVDLKLDTVFSHATIEFIAREITRKKWATVGNSTSDLNEKLTVTI